MKVVHVAQDPVEAQIVAGFLRAHGIEAFVGNEALCCDAGESARPPRISGNPPGARDALPLSVAGERPAVGSVRAEVGFDASSAPKVLVGDGDHDRAREVLAQRDVARERPADRRGDS